MYRENFMLLIPNTKPISAYYGDEEPYTELPVVAWDDEEGTPYVINKRDGYLVKARSFKNFKYIDISKAFRK